MYLDKVLPKKWIKSHGGKFEDELLALKEVRNAVVHNNRDLNENSNPNALKIVNKFLSTLDSKLRYYEVDVKGIVTTHKSIFTRCRLLGVFALRSAGDAEKTVKKLRGDEPY